jgi:hypothetical protein
LGHRFFDAPNYQEVSEMYDSKLNLEPGNPDGNTVLRYLMEVKQLPLESAIDRVYKEIAKYSHHYRSEQKKLLGGAIATGVLSVPIVFPWGVPSALVAGAVAASFFRWQELGTMRDRLKPEYALLKQSVLLEQFIKWLAQQIHERRGQEDLLGGPAQFRSDALTPGNILKAYEDTVFSVAENEHLHNNASDPVLALFVLKLRQHTNHLPPWVVDAFRQLEQAEVQRANDVDRASRYMWGNLEERYPEKFQQSQPIGQNTRLGAIEVSADAVEGEQRLGKHPTETSQPQLPSSTNVAKITVLLFDFSRLRTEPDKFAHLRIIGGTGIGKTTFADWLLDVLGGECFIITPKKKAWNWTGLKVYGLWFDYETIRAKLQWIHSEMYRRYPLMEAGENFEVTNFVVDEWRLINTNVKAIKQRNPETKQLFEVAPSAKAMMKDIITVARESMLRLIALAQGENVETWGFEGESDLEECFTDIRLGEFAINYAKSLRNQCRKDSEEYEYWSAVLAELEWQESRYTTEGKSIPCCMVGKMPARIPNLSYWKREGVETSSSDVPPVEGEVFKADELIDDLTWNQMILGMSEDEINRLIEERRSKSLSDTPDLLDTIEESVSDTLDTPAEPIEGSVSTPGYVYGQGIEGVLDTSDTYEADTYLNTYQAENFAKDFPEWSEPELLIRIRDTTLPPGRFIKEDLKITNGEKNKLARKAVGYLVRKYGDWRLMEKFKDYL